MRTTRLFALCSALILGANLMYAQRIKGSDTMLPLSQRLAEQLAQKNKKNKVTVTGGGTGVGITALLEQTTELAQASRRIKYDERKKIEQAGHKLKSIIVAYDALAIVVHPSNKVRKLTREQLEGIFTGRIVNWKELGGADLKIIPYSRETSSGTNEFFKEKVLGKRDYVSGILSMPATGAIIQSIGQTKGAIGYVGLAYLNPSVAAVSVSYDAGKSYVAPSVAHAQDQTYPIVRPLYYYYIDSTQGKVQTFIDYALSSEGQSIVAQVGFIPAKK